MAQDDLCVIRHSRSNMRDNAGANGYKSPLCEPARLLVRLQAPPHRQNLLITKLDRLNVVMIVVLDTNIWLKELVLNSASGSALRFFLKRRPARLAVPEVVRLEVQANVRSLITDAMEDVKRGNRQLLAIFGRQKEIVLPTSAEVDALVSGLFTDLGIEIIDVPFTLESAQASFLKTIQKLPPSDKSQEFKDGVLWANCLELLEQDDVLLASQDKAFFLSRELGRGLAANLAAEAARKPHWLTLVHSVSDVLKQVETPLNLDKAWLAKTLMQRAQDGVNQLLGRCEAEISGNASGQYELFATEKPDFLFMKYKIEVPCTDLSGSGRTNMKMFLEGSGSLHSSLTELADVNASAEWLVFNNTDGSEGQNRTVYASFAATMGHRIVTHSVRHPLKDSN